MVRCSLCVIVTALSLSTASAQTLAGCADILDAIPSTIPLHEARALAVVPGGRATSPQGVFFVKGEKGWSEPEFVTLRGAVSTGTRETPDYVLLFRTRRSVEQIANGDGKLDADVVVYTHQGGTFARASLSNAALRKSGLFAGAPNRKQAAELKTKLTDLTTTKVATESPLPVTTDWVRLLEHREVFMGGFAALGAGLAMLKRRKR